MQYLISLNIKGSPPLNISERDRRYAAHYIETHRISTGSQFYHPAHCTAPFYVLKVFYQPGLLLVKCRINRNVTMSYFMLYPMVFLGPINKKICACM